MKKKINRSKSNFNNCIQYFIAEHKIFIFENFKKLFYIYVPD